MDKTKKTKFNHINLLVIIRNIYGRAIKANIPILAPVTLRSIQISKNELNSVKKRNRRS